MHATLGPARVHLHCVLFLGTFFSADFSTDAPRCMTDRENGLGFVNIQYKTALRNTYFYSLTH